MLPILFSEFKIAADLLHFLLMFNLIHENKTGRRKTEGGGPKTEGRRRVEGVCFLAPGAVFRHFSQGRLSRPRISVRAFT
jgi:hypothetical protein